MAGPKDSVVLSWTRCYLFTMIWIALICLKWIPSIMKYHLQVWYQGHHKIWLDLPLMIDAAFCAGAAMISFGAILGKVSPSQLMYLLILEVRFFFSFWKYASTCSPSECGACSSRACNMYLLV